ncbi:MAG: bifunctional metallophosphatase/5'-nucleotidase, partial [Solirubrobacteraceae bacterium]
MRSSSRRLAALTASIAAAGLAAASTAAAAPPPHSQANLGKKPDFRLTLLHNNDGESKLATGDSKAGYGGAARFETVVERLRAEAAVAPVGRENRDKPKGTGTLLVSSGDNFLAGLALLLGFQQGPPWPDAVVANALGYDAMTIGNHEFDFGQVRLAEYIEGVDDDIPFITANLGFEGTALEDLADEGRIAPAAVVERDGERIGIIGLTTPDISSISSPGNVRIERDLAPVVNGQVAELEARGVDKIIVSAHLQGIAADEALIPLVHGVDVWIAGGGDDLLANADDTLIPGDVSVGAYPTAVTDADGKSLLVVSTAGEYKYVGRLTVDFDKAGEVVGYDDAKSGPVRVSGTPTDPDYAEEDAFIKANAVDPVAAFSAGLASQPNGTTEVTLRRTATVTNDPIRRREAGYGSLVADSFLWKARQLAATAGVDAPQVGLTNGGGIRADIAAGPINKAQTFAALPFFNQIVVVEDIPCTSLKALLERAYSALPAIDGRFGHLAGLRVVVDRARTAQVINPTPPVAVTVPGERVRDVWLDNGTPQNTADDTQLVAGGAVVPGCAAVDLATTDFTAKDGDGYPFVSQGLTFTPVGALYNQAFEDYIVAPAAQGGL